MIERLFLYQLKCDKCNDRRSGMLAALTPDAAAKLAEPQGWAVKQTESGDTIHLCAPCDGRNWPEEGTVFE